MVGTCLHGLHHRFSVVFQLLNTRGPIYNRVICRWSSVIMRNNAKQPVKVLTAGGKRSCLKNHIYSRRQRWGDKDIQGRAIHSKHRESWSIALDNKLTNHIPTEIFKMTLEMTTAADILSNCQPTIKTKQKLAITHCSGRSLHAHFPKGPTAPPTVSAVKSATKNQDDKTRTSINLHLSSPKRRNRTR